MTERDEEREERIEMRIIIDAYTVEEQAYGGTPTWTTRWTFSSRRGVPLNARNPH